MKKSSGLSRKILRCRSSCAFSGKMQSVTFSFPTHSFPGKGLRLFFFSLLYLGKWLVRVLTILTLLLRVKKRTKGWVKIKGKTVLRCCLCVFQFERAGFLNTVLFSGKILLVMFFSSCPLSRKCQVLYYFFLLFRYEPKKKHKRMDSNKGEDIMSGVWRSCLWVWVWVSQPQFEWKTK